MEDILELQRQFAMSQMQVEQPIVNKRKVVVKVAQKQPETPQPRRYRLKRKPLSVAEQQLIHGKQAAEDERLKEILDLWYESAMRYKKRKELFEVDDTISIREACKEKPKVPVYIPVEPPHIVMTEQDIEDEIREREAIRIYKEHKRLGLLRNV